MFKKFNFLLVLAAVFSLQACAQEKWVEGTHFKVISSQATEKPEVMEFFSFWCPHCLAYEPIVTDIKANLDQDVAFKKMHVNFMRFTTPQIQNAATRALIVARELDQEEQMITAIFKFIQIDRNVVTGFNDFRDLFIASGINAEEFDKIATSFSINSALMKSNNEVDKYKQNISGVPSFIVNGKYLATFTRDMNQKDIVELINYLTKLQ